MAGRLEMLGAHRPDVAGVELGEQQVGRLDQLLAGHAGLVGRGRGRLEVEHAVQGSGQKYRVTTIL